MVKELTPKEIYNLCSQHFKFFVEEIIGLHNEPFHNELDDILSNDIYKQVAITFARGHGKSTHISVAYPLWEISKNHNIRILLISSTGSVSRSFMTEIINHIERNTDYTIYSKAVDPKHIGVIPKMKNYRNTEVNWSGDSIIIDRDDLNLKDPTIHGVGVFGSILSKRADIIICDDVVNQENSATQEQREKVIDWIYTTVMPVLIPGGKFIYLGNTWHQDDLVSRLMKDPQFDYKKRNPAILHESDNPQLWQEWTKIILDEMQTIENRKQQAEAFYQENKVTMDSGVQLLWPSRFSYKDLYLTRLANPYSFARMYQCDPADRPNQRIKDEWLEAACKKGAHLKLQDEPREYIMDLTTEGLDLAISQKETSDDNSYLTLDRVDYGTGDIKRGDYIIRQVQVGKMSPNEVRLMVKDHWERLKPNGIRVESVGYQEAMVRDLNEELKIPVHGYHTGGEKNDPDIGVNSLAILLENGRLVLPYNNEDPRTIQIMSRLMNEMRAFPDGHTGDILMSLWFAYSEARDLSGKKIVFPTLMNFSTKVYPNLSDPEVLKVETEKAEKKLTAEQMYERQFLAEQMRGLFRR